MQSRIPVPQRCGSDVRLMQIVDALLAHNHELTFVSSWIADGENELWELLQRGVHVLHEDAAALGLIGVDRLPRWNFERLLTKESFDIAILCLWFWQQFTVPEIYLESIRRLSPRTGVVILSDDRHGERERSLARLAPEGAEGALHFEYAEDVAFREKESYNLVDSIITVTDVDRLSAEKMTPRMLPIWTIPFLASAATVARTAQFSDRSGLLFLGNFTNPATDDACNWLLNEVMPEIRLLLPKMRLTLAGYGSERWAGQGLLEVEVLGSVEELQPVFDRHLVFISPVRVGTGISTKNMTAMAAGLALVTTPMGAIGLPGEAPDCFRVREDAAGLAHEVVEVCGNAGVWEFMVEGARSAVRTLPSGAELNDVLETVMRDTRPGVGNVVKFSTRAVEERIHGLRTLLPSTERRTERLRALTLLGQELVARGWVEDGLVQLRHALTAVRFGADPGRGLGTLLDMMAHGYGLLGDRPGVSRSRQAAGEVRAAFLKG